MSATEESEPEIIEKPLRQSPIYSPPIIGDRLLGFGVFVLVLFIGCAWFLLTAGKEYKTLSLVLGACWVIGVPIFFFVEHTYFFRKWGDPAQYDQFKRLQDQAAKIWAAAIFVLAAFFAQNFPGN
jgi:hypothetical protein